MSCGVRAATAGRPYSIPFPCGFCHSLPLGRAREGLGLGLERLLLFVVPLVAKEIALLREGGDSVDLNLTIK